MAFLPFYDCFIDLSIHNIIWKIIGYQFWICCTKVVIIVNSKLVNSSFNFSIDKLAWAEMWNVIVLVIIVNFSDSILNSWIIKWNESFMKILSLFFSCNNINQWVSDFLFSFTWHVILWFTILCPIFMKVQNNGNIILPDKFLKREKRGRNYIIQNIAIPLCTTLALLIKR